MTRSLLRTFALTSLCTTAISMFAQDASEPTIHTLFGSNGPTHNSGWGAPMAAYTRIMDQDAMLTGLRGGWLIDHRLTIGLAGYGLTTVVHNTGYDSYLMNKGLRVNDRSHFQMGYGGLLIEPVIAYTSPVHITLPILIGAGGCAYTNTALPHDEFDPYTYHDDAQAFFVAEAGVNLELNVVKMVRLGIGGSYRYTSDLDLPATPKDALRGFNATFTVKVGVF